MRSLLLAAGVCILALNFAGCSCTTSSSCSGLSPGMNLSGDCGPTCSTCDSGCDAGQCQGGCDSCGGRGLSLPRPMIVQRLRGRMQNAGSMANCGCSDSNCGCNATAAPAPAMGRCDGGCGDAGCGGQCGGRSRLGLGLFEAGPACQSAGGSCDGTCGGRCGALGGRVKGKVSDLVSRVQSRAGCGVGGCGMGGDLCGRCRGSLGGGQLLNRVKGCGRFGCGFGGKLCGRCKGGNEIPHREPQMNGAGQVPSYVYPYYTTRAPRDFLMDNPPTIGY